MKLTAGFVAAVLSTLGASAAVGGAYQDITSTNLDYRPPGAHLTVRQAVRIAEQQALLNKFTLAEYQRPTFSYSSDNHWLILYKWKTDIPGGYFYVDIDDRTRRAMLMPGE